MMVSVGSVAEWSKALVLGTSLFGGVGSNPTAAKSLFWLNSLELKAKSDCVSTCVSSYFGQVSKCTRLRIIQPRVGNKVQTRNQ